MNMIDYLIVIILRNSWVGRLYNRSILKIFYTIPFLGKVLLRRKDHAIVNYLDKKYGNIINDFHVESKQSYDLIKEDAPIYIFWWDGFENAPEIVKHCVKSVIRNADCHIVILLSKDNYDEYVNIPLYIVEAVKDGSISLAHFADVLRVALLAERGGIWMDATLFMTDSFEDDIYKYNFYSLKSALEENPLQEREPALSRWRVFFMASAKGAPLMELCKRLLYTYICQEQQFIDYFLLDYMILLCYEKNVTIKQMVDDIPYSNPRLYDLYNSSDLIYTEEYIDRILKSTSLHKFEWRHSYTQDTESVYKCFIEDYGKN